MAALLAFIVILFAPVVGFEPQDLDNAASALFFFPYSVPIASVAVGGACEVAYYWRAFRKHPGTRVRALCSALVLNYATAAVLGFMAAWLLRSTVLDSLSLVQILVGTGIGLFLGTVLLTSHLLRLRLAGLGLGKWQWRVVLAVVLLGNLCSLIAAFAANRFIMFLR